MTYEYLPVDYTTMRKGTVTQGNKRNPRQKVDYCSVCGLKASIPLKQPKDYATGNYLPRYATHNLEVVKVNGEQQYKMGKQCLLPCIDHSWVYDDANGGYCEICGKNYD